MMRNPNEIQLLTTAIEILKRPLQCPGGMPMAHEDVIRLVDGSVKTTKGATEFKPQCKNPHFGCPHLFDSNFPGREAMEYVCNIILPKLFPNNETWYGGENVFEMLQKLDEQLRIARTGRNIQEISSIPSAKEAKANAEVLEGIWSDTMDSIEPIRKQLLAVIEKLLQSDKK